MWFRSVEELRTDIQTIFWTSAVIQEKKVIFCLCLALSYHTRFCIDVGMLYNDLNVCDRCGQLHNNYF